jgi:hypothetical protein
MNWLFLGFPPFLSWKNQMTSKIAKLVVIAAILQLGVCPAQQIATEKAVEWGKDVQGVRLSLTMTNKVIDIGSTVEITAIIKNASTNSIGFELIGTPADYDLILTNATKKLYHLTSPDDFDSSRWQSIDPGRENIRQITVTFKNNIAPGEYTLEASRVFGMKDHEYKLVSNPIKVRIK